MIRISDSHTATKVLNLFGKYISKLILRQLRRGDDFKITDLINLHCADSLTELTVDIIEPRKEYFGDLTSFTRLETLQLQGPLQSLDSPTHKFNERFPALKNLIFLFTNVTDDQ